MATATKTYVFTGSAESWAYTGSQVEDTGSAVNDRLENGCDGRNKLGAGYWEITGTFASIFGIDSSATVTGYSAASYSGTCTAYNVATDCTHGTFTVNDGTARTLIAAQSAYTAASQTRTPSGDPGISGLSLPATTSITLTLNHSSDTGNNTSASARLSWDDVSVSIEWQTGAQSLTQSSTFDDSTDTFYAPTVTTGAVTLTATRYDNSQAFYAPTVANVNYTLGPGLSLLLGMNLHTGAAVEYTLGPGLLLPLGMNLAASASGSLVATRFDNTQTFYAPVVTTGAVTLTPDRYDSGQTFYAPVVATGAVTLTAARYDNSQSFYAPTVTTGAVTLTATRYDNGQSFYSPTVTTGSVGLTPDRYDNSQSFYGPSVTVGAVTLTAGLYTNSQSFYGPTVTTGSVALSPSRHDNSQTFYSPLVSTGGLALLVDRYDNSQSFYSPAVTTGAVGLTAARYDNAQTFYAPVVSAGGLSLVVDRYDNSQAFYAPVVTATVTLTAARYDNAQAFYSPLVEQAGAQALTVSLVENLNQFYLHSLTGGEQAQESSGGSSISRTSVKKVKDWLEWKTSVESDFTVEWEIEPQPQRLAGVESTAPDELTVHRLTRPILRLPKGRRREPVRVVVKRDLRAEQARRHKARLMKDDEDLMMLL